MSWPLKALRLSFLGLFTFVPLIFLPLTSELFEFNKIILTYALAATILCFWLIRCLLENRLIFTRTPLDLPLLLFLGCQFLSLLFSLDPQISLLGYYGRWNGGLLSLLCYSLLYWAAVSNLDRQFALSCLRMSLAAACLISVYAIAQSFGVDDHLWVQDVKNRVFSTLGQPNWLAAYLLTLLFFPLAAISFSYSTRHTLPLLTIFALLFAALLLTKSRSGLLAFAIGLLCLAILLAHQYQATSQLKTSLKPFAIAFLLIAILTLVVPNPIRDRLYRFTPPPPPAGTALETGGTESGIIRGIVWQGALAVWRSSPKTFWLGTGPETFALSYYQHRPLAHNQTSEWELLYNKAHNEFLNFLATTGLLGFSSYLLLLLAMFFLLLKSLAPAPSAASFALASGWLTLSVTNFWGFSVVATQLALFLFPAFAWLASHPISSPPAAQPIPVSIPRKLLICLCLCGLLGSWYLLARYWLADYHLAQSQKNEHLFTSTESTSYLLSTYEHALTALSLNPQEPNMHLQLASATAYLSLVTQETDATTSAQLAEISDHSSQNAIALSPAHPSLYKSRARSLIILSATDPKYLDLAAQTLSTAQTLSPTDPRLPFNLGLVYLFKGKLDTASAYFKSSLRLKPDFADAKLKLDEIASRSANQPTSAPTRN